ncbi:MAG: c-type cytochrome [Acidobacteriota bacterium]|jgi:mono/diheme cytochrome c family protein|nr:cytochrome c [Bryobacteraceae bacterium CoA2 C42]MCA2963122.1 cytochrome c [Acidobacteriaceae bacterium]MCA2967546.1 cytochrome c [Acidobacteriaceae bacterium]MCX6589121.1 c-type cytochrome [Acidobacteriota bacterium]
MRLAQGLMLAGLLPGLLAGETGAALYRAKCASCHGAKGEGRAAIKRTSLLTEEVRKKTDAELTQEIAAGGKRKSAAHAYEQKGVTAEQVKLLVQYVRELQR